MLGAFPRPPVPMNRQSILVALATVLLAVLAYLAGRQQAPTANEASTAAEADAPAATAAANADAVVAAPAARPVRPLPDPALPLPGVVAELEQRARAGEAAAACRLAAEWSHCSALPERRAEFDAWLAERRLALDMLPEAMRAEAAANIERDMPLREQALRELRQHCGDVPVPSPSEVARMWRTAALGGNPAALRQYASGHAFKWGTLMDSLPELATYRAEAAGLAQMAASRGDLDLALALASAYAPTGRRERTLLLQSVPADPAQGLALYRRIEAALDASGHGDTRVAMEVTERIASLEKSLSPEQLADAVRHAGDMQARWQPLQVRGARQLRASGSVRPIERAWCGR